MALDPEKLEAILKDGDVPACLAFFRGASEADRKKVAKIALARLRALRADSSATMIRLLARSGIDPSMSGLAGSSESLADSYRAARVAVLASASLSQLKSLGIDGVPPDLADTILADRRPPWLDELAERLCDLELRIGSYWTTVRRLVREGFCRAPGSVGYVEGMIQALPSECWRRKTDLKALLLEDPGLLQDEIWRIFVTEPRTGRIQLPETWGYTLLELAREGAIPRTRLLDATLDGLERDFHETRARSFATIHERLVPTIEEQSDRSARYLALLASRNPSTVAFALKAIAPLDKAGVLDPPALAASIVPALYFRAKGAVKLALRLLDSAARRGADALTPGQAAAIAVEALVHESPEVQEIALDLIDRHGDPSSPTLRPLLLERAGALAPSQRNRLEAWLGATPAHSPYPAASPTETEALIARADGLEARWARIAGVPEARAALQHGADVPALTFDGSEIPRLDPARALMPIQELDELIDLLAGLIEDSGSPDDCELALDGVSRLCNQRPEDFATRTAPLSSRVQALRKDPSPVPPGTIGMSLRNLVSSWITGEVRGAFPNVIRASTG